MSLNEILIIVPSVSALLLSFAYLYICKTSARRIKRNNEGMARIEHALKRKRIRG